MKLFVEMEIDADKVTSVTDAGEVGGSQQSYVSLASDVVVRLGPYDTVTVIGPCDEVGMALSNERDDALPTIEISWL